MRSKSTYSTVHITKKISKMWSNILTLSALLAYFSTSAEHYHHSLVGEYYVEWREIGPCPPDQRGTNEIFTDVHLTRRHRKAEVVGNLSFGVTFDDTMPTKMNFAVLGSNSGWLPNAYTMYFPEGCSSFISVLGTGWLDYMKSFGMPPRCPMQKGFYQTKGFDTDGFLRSKSLPTKFIYGRYRVTIESFNKKNVLIGCTYFSIDVLPLWQKKRTQKST